MGTQTSEGGGGAVFGSRALRTARISASELDQRITLQTRTSGVDAVGQDIETWNDLITVWARVRPLRGRDLIIANSAASKDRIVFGIRYMPGVDSTERLIWKSQTYDITVPPINVDGANHTIEIMCTSGEKIDPNRGVIPLTQTYADPTYFAENYVA